jgi:methyl-accepting chemotaxis protein
MRTMKVLRNLSTRGKMLCLISLMAVFLIMVGGTGYYQAMKAETSLKTMYQEQLLPIKWINELRSNNRANEAIVFQMILQKDPNKRQEYMQELQERIVQADELLANYEKTNLDAKEQEILNRVKSALAEYRNDRTQVIKLIEEQNPDEAFFYYLATEKTLDGINNDLKELAN